jgi:hypothetical protein
VIVRGDANVKVVQKFQPLKSPLEKGGFRGICSAGLLKIPLSPFAKGGNPARIMEIL